MFCNWSFWLHKSMRVEICCLFFLLTLIHKGSPSNVQIGFCEMTASSANWIVEDFLQRCWLLLLFMLPISGSICSPVLQAKAQYLGSSGAIDLCSQGNPASCFHCPPPLYWLIYLSREGPWRLLLPLMRPEMPEKVSSWASQLPEAVIWLWWFVLC